jgi:hypothetical protein
MVFGAALLAACLISGCGKPEVPVKGTLTVTSEPAGASVLINNRELGKTPFGGDSGGGNYLLEIRAPGFESSWLNLNLEPGEQAVRHVRLKALTGKAMISSDPAGARVMVKGELKGITPLIMKDLPLGNYEAMLEKSGFEPVPVSWKIMDARPQLISVPMASNVGILVVKSVPDRVTVSLNDKTVGRTLYRTNLEAGQYRLKLSAPGYADITRNIMVTQNKTLTEEFVMTELAGTLEVITVPPKAEVFIGERSYGITPLKIDGLKADKYTVTIRRENFDSVVREVEIGRGVRQVLELEMTKNTSGIDLVVNPPGVTVYMDGKVIGVTEKGEHEHLSKTISLRDLNAGEYTLVFAHKRARPERITRSVTLKKGEVNRLQPVTMWVANAELKLKDSSPQVVQILGEDVHNVYYSPDPGVRVPIARSKIEFIKKLEDPDAAN